MTGNIKTAVIVCHDFIYGPPHELRDYLLSRGVKDLLFIGHVNRYVFQNKLTQSYCEHWKNGKLGKKYFAPQHHYPEALSYVLDVFYSVYWPLKILHRAVDVFIGAGNINAIAGILLGSMGKVKKTVYYVIDYAQVRFKNKLLNTLYHALDAACARCSSSTWNYSEVMIKQRSARWKRVFPRQQVVPNGIRIRPSIIVDWEKCNTHELLYMGTLSGFQGVDTAIVALPIVRAKYKDATLVVIGDGKERRMLEELARKQHLQKQVVFTGFIDDPREMEKRIAHASIGLACYDTNHPLVLTTEPGKVKRYLACGIPVVMTNVSPLAKELEKNNCGMITSHHPDKLAKTILRFFDDSALLRQSRKNALTYARHFEWKRLFRQAFERIEK